MEKGQKNRPKLTDLRSPQKKFKKILHGLKILPRGALQDEPKKSYLSRYSELFAKHANVRKWPFSTTFSALCRLQLGKKCPEMWKNRVFALWTLTIQNIPRLSKTYILGPILSPKRSVSGFSTFSHATCATAKSPEGHFSHGRKNWPTKSELISKNQLPGDRLACTQKQLRGHPRTLGAEKKNSPDPAAHDFLWGWGLKTLKRPLFWALFSKFRNHLGTIFWPILRPWNGQKPPNSTDFADSDRSLHDSWRRVVPWKSMGKGPKKTDPNSRT